MSVFTETDQSMTVENWKTGRHPVTVVTVVTVSKSKMKTISQASKE